MFSGWVVPVDPSVIWTQNGSLLMCVQPVWKPTGVPVVSIKTL